MNSKRIKTLLFMFCLCCGGYSLYLITNAIFGNAGKEDSLKIEKLDVPRHFDKTGDEFIQPENFVDDETYRQILRFRQYMDSLQVNEKGQYDSIITARPGLMDSVQMLEELYHSQKLK